jgi:hypothetical protein
MLVIGDFEAIFPLTVCWDLGKYPENVTTGVLSEPVAAVREVARRYSGG